MQKTLTIALLALVCPGWSQGQKKSTAPLTLFSIQEQPVGVDEFTYLYRKNHIKAEDFTEQKVNEYINLFINFKLKVKEAKARGLDTTATFLKEFRTYKDELKRPFTAEKDLLAKLTEETYRRQTEEIKASHILVTVKPEAPPGDTLAAFKKILTYREKIISGADFEKMAREISDDPSAKSNGGNLGYFTALQMVYPFEQAAYSLKPGEISQPIRTRFGYHLIKVYDRRPARGEVEVSHILLRSGTTDDTKIKNKAFEIEDQLQGGRSWDELCKEYSDDPATRNSGGRLKPFGIGALAGVPEFEEVAFSLKEPNEISDPFKSAYGWHIIRLERKIPLPAYKEVEASLQRKVSRDERMQISNRKAMEARKIKYHYSEDPKVKNELFAMADSSLQKGQWRFKGMDAFRSNRLFTLAGKKETAGMFISYAEREQQANSFLPRTYIEQLYEKFLEEKLNDAEEVQLMSENAEFKALVTEYKEGILLFTIMEQEVWNKASQDTTGQRFFYQTNKEKYPGGNRVRAALFSSTDKGFMEGILAKVVSGDSIRKQDSKKFKSVQPMRNYERGENKAIDKVQWTIGSQLTEVDGTYYLVVIESLIPPGIKGREEAHAQVISDYQDYLEKKWVIELKQKYTVKVNNKGKKFVINELTKK